MVKINQVASFKSCLTCVYRKPYPATKRNGQSVFYCFVCGLAMDSSRVLVRPEEFCDYWQAATPYFEKTDPGKINTEVDKDVEDR